MIKEAFLICSLAAPSTMSFMGHHSITEDDAQAFSAFTESVRHQQGKDPAIVFVYNYFDVAKRLRDYGVRAYSMTIQMAVGHVRGELHNFPFQHASLGGLVLLQKVPYAGLFEGLDAIALNGIVAIHNRDLPYLGEVILNGMGFRRTSMSWHDMQIYRRGELKMFLSGHGYDVFNMKKVVPPTVVHKPILESA